MGVSIEGQLTSANHSNDREAAEGWDLPEASHNLIPTWVASHRWKAEMSSQSPRFAAVA